MEVDFAGKTFYMVDRLTGEAVEIIVFVAILIKGVSQNEKFCGTLFSVKNE